MTVAGKYRYEINPSGVDWWWHVHVSRIGWSPCRDFGSFGSRDRAVRRAMKVIAKYEAEDERQVRLTVEGP